MGLLLALHVRIVVCRDCISVYLLLFLILHDFQPQKRKYEDYTCSQVTNAIKEGNIGLREFVSNPFYIDTRGSIYNSNVGKRSLKKREIMISRQACRTTVEVVNILW